MITPTVATNQSPNEGFSEFFRLRDLVEAEGACSLPGVTLKYDKFLPVMWKAVSKGFVSHENAAFVAEGLRYGFKAGVDITSMRGHRWFKNYPSSVEEGCASVISGTCKRVNVGKTLDLGVWTSTLANFIRTSFEASAIFPLGVDSIW